MNKNDQENNISKKPWPTKAAMQQVYDMHLWGGHDSDFYSGEGSHRPEIIKPYIDVVSTFLKSFANPITVCDLGCGDFNVGKELVPHTKRYVAVDIVENLIARNKRAFKGVQLEFQCLDLAIDDLPPADCALLRQVLQHLSNAEIQHIANKLSNYKYVIITEHLPKGDFEPNRDIISGQGTRLKKQSGVDVLAAPFHFKMSEATELLSLSSDIFKGRIVTMLYKMF
ncbi:bifunctional 2-polyprenyl-6-hydroxyphenol methylase/3-demethylubiquinol 3-O-methyltransferase UbiG [Sediminibacter sp. Hel_I_10]|uniref:class I SAM-dependent methyltransferase n=1 Tax=Sediminibacter sp. Hel_I_10 TaxID=1392490 RepID=UPI00047BE78D|nr:class I SAM-dependent methyltransferase [Sediminibacter sp. Hel_I_10]